MFIKLIIDNQNNSYRLIKIIRILGFIGNCFLINFHGGDALKILKTISSKEAAEILGIAEHTLANWRYLGQGPKFYRPSRRIIYLYDEVVSYLIVKQGK